MDNDLKTVIALLKRALTLKELPRIGWIMEGGKRSDSDSVAAHSYMVVLTSLLLAKQLQKVFGPFDIGKILTMATLHDLAECVTGDFDSGLKRRIESKVNQRMIFEEIEQEALSSLIADIDGNNNLLSIQCEFDEGKTKEAKLVKFADVFDAFAHGHDRLGKIFNGYLTHSKEHLRRDSPDADQGLGAHLAGWVDLLVSEWKSITPAKLD